MAANEKWQRWTYASLFDALKTDLDAVSIETHFTSSRKSRTNSWEAAKTKAEITISGPSTRRVSPTQHIGYVDVFAVVTTTLDDANNYGHADAVGQIVKALDKCFVIKDYGDTGLIDVTVLQLRNEAEGIDVNDLAPAAVDTQTHSTILARYEGRFSS